jgi:hypothetical protein
MQKARFGSSGWRKACFWMIAALFFVYSAATCFAQQRAGLSPEKQAAVQKLETQYVAKKLKLSDENTSKLVSAYMNARKSYADAREALRTQGSRDFQAFRDLQDKESKKLESDLGKFLDEKQVKKAMESLGTFNATWDRMVDALAGFNLQEKALDKALDNVNDYIIESAKLMQQARESGSFQEMRPKLQELRQKLDKDMEGVLSKEQLEQWKQVAAPRGRG